MSKNKQKDLIYKAPVVTVMGHVDHGKTSLLDHIRHANVAGKEVGGITQKIGGYQIEHNHKKITFIDTPGHEAFSAMRERGASVTDIIILVVAADDGVQNQTREVINLFKKSNNIHMIVAVNKMDMPGADSDRVKRELASEGLLLEGWGGDIPVVEISAKTGLNIDTLLETIQLVAEMEGIDKMEPLNPDLSKDYLSESVIIESYLDKALGPVATCIVKAGELKRGDYLIAGGDYTKVRALIDQNNKTINSAVTSDPVLIVGLLQVQNTGEIVRTYATDKLARENSHKSINDSIKEEVSEIKDELEEHLDFFGDEDTSTIFRIILKADTKGSLDAIISSLDKINVEGMKLKIISSGLGPVTKSDVDFAQSTRSLIVAFGVDVPKILDAEIKLKKVIIRKYQLIYQLLEELEAVLLSLVLPEEEESVIGSAVVKNVFILSNKKVVAGCEVKTGKIVKGYKMYVERKNERIHEAKISSLRHLKDEVKESSVGQECGILFEPDFEIQTGDKIVVFVMEKI